ncbi:MAG: DUF2270 domain-containing protein [Proteobacteria bacterium]|nr:DUF2270 domain-containing protein [Pseudomonadota bacterium]
MEAPSEPRVMNASEIGALAHLYRGEVYRSTVWRTRLDTTTNWAVVTLGVALSITFASPSASPLPLLLVGILILFFLVLEARRYRYFNVWRARCRWIEVHFFARLLDDGEIRMDGWQQRLANDYRQPDYHVSLLVATGRRVRRNYLWILAIQSAAYAGKLTVHPAPMQNLSEFVARARIGPLPGSIVLAIGVIYILSWSGLAVWSWSGDRQRARARSSRGGMG